MVFHVVIPFSVYLLNVDVQKRKKTKKIQYQRVLANLVKNKCLLQLELQVIKSKT